MRSARDRQPRAWSGCEPSTSSRPRWMTKRAASCSPSSRVWESSRKTFDAKAPSRKAFDAKARRRKEKQEQEFRWLLESLLEQDGKWLDSDVENLRRKDAKTQRKP